MPPVLGGLGQRRTTGRSRAARPSRPCRSRLRSADRMGTADPNAFNTTPDTRRYRRDGRSLAPYRKPASTWLAALQNAWLDGRALPKAPTVEAPACIEIHICHSLTRQLEVLHDRLLALFNANDADTAPPSPSDA